MIRLVSTPPPLAQLKRFEALFPPELQEDSETLQRLRAEATTASVWAYVDGKLVGEQIVVDQTFVRQDDSLKYLPELHTRPFFMYVYCTAVLPENQSSGLAVLMSAYVLGAARAMGYETLCGHATTPRMREIRRLLGAKESMAYMNWMGSDRKAVYYEHSL